VCNDDSGAPLRATAHGRSRPAARRRAVQAGRTIERGWVRGSASSASTSTSAPDIGLAGGQVQARRDGERLPVPERVKVLRDEVALWLCTTPGPGAAPRGIGGGARGSTRTCPQRWRRPRPRATGPARAEPAVEQRSGMGRSGDIDPGGTRFGQGACTGRPRSHAVLVVGAAQKVGGVLPVTGGRAFPSKAAARHLPDGAPSRGCKRLSSSLLAKPFRPAARRNLQIA